MKNIVDILVQIDILVVLGFCAFIIWQVRGVVDEQRRQGKVQNQILDQAKKTNGQVSKNKTNIAILMERTQKK